MFDVADARDRLPDDTLVARVVSLSGFGSRHGGEAVAVAPSGDIVAGRLLAGLVDEVLARAVPDVGVVAAHVSDPVAEDAGMACGGHARLLVQRIDQLPAPGWTALAARRPVVIASALGTGATRVIVDGDDPAGSVGAADAEVDRIATDLLRTGRSAVEVHDLAGGEVLVESLLPPTTVRIVGHAGVGVALAAQAELLGWRHETVDGADAAAEAARSLASHDALVVLSHDASVDTPALAAALEHGRGYIGALGSRGTQAARRERLAGQGLEAAAIATIHGPVGLDLGSRTPAETAVAIVAEIIAHRAGRTAASLASHDGPING